MTYAELERALFARARAGMKLGLERMERTLAALGNPHHAAPVVHVAGTNGKGSTCAFIDASLRAAGLRTALYTSPHLERFTERFRVDGVEIAQAQLVALYEELGERAPFALEGPHALTFFELVTALAFMHFARERVDVMVVEVGLGGRHDATNVVRPAVTCITPIGLDHQEFLGPTIAAIADEKAGIVKRVPCVSARQVPEAHAVIAHACDRQGTSLVTEGLDFSLSRTGDTWSWNGPLWRIDGLKLGLRGAHQESNAAVALAALEVLAWRGLPVRAEHAAIGLATTRWAGRLETVSLGPEIVLDGAHNPHGAQALAAAIPGLFRGRAIRLVLGVLADKDAEPLVRLLAPLARDVVVTRPASPRALPPDALAAIVRRYHDDVRIVELPALAVRSASARAGPGDVVLVCGSLYLVGEVRAGLRGATAGGPAEVLRA